MKRIISIACFILLVLSLGGLTVSSVSEESLKQVKNLHLTTGGKLHQLQLSWDVVDGAEGYQIIRSANGKAKTFKRIATIRNAKQNTYTDTALKNATPYYYKIRAFRKVDKKNMYGKYSDAVNLSTRITKTAAEKLYQKAYMVYHDWFLTTAYVDDSTLCDLDNGYSVAVKHPTIHTKRQLQKYFAQFFTKKVYKEPLKYYWSFENSDRLYTYYLGESPNHPYTDSTTKSKISTIQDTSCVYTRIGQSTNGSEKAAERYLIVYQNGKWLFDSGFSSAFPLYYGA